MNKNVHLYVVPYNVIFPLGGILSLSRLLLFLSQILFSLSPPLLLTFPSLPPSLPRGGRAGLFICLHKPNLFLQPDVSWQASVSGAAGSPHPHPHHSQVSKAVTSLRLTESPINITQDGCVFKGQIDCGYRSYGIIYHGEYYLGAGEEQESGDGGKAYC